jgi:uncharacterized membrane protein
MRRTRWILPIAFAAFALCGAGPAHAVVATDAESPARVDYRNDVWPIIKDKCVECHNPKKRQGSLDMTTRAAMLNGGDSGAAFVAGNVEQSLMIELIEFDEMPPRNQKKPPVTKAELQKLRDWISAGALVPDEPDQPPAR